MDMLKRIKRTIEAYYVTNREYIKPEEVEDLEEQITFMDVQIKKHEIRIKKRLERESKNV